MLRGLQVDAVINAVAYTAVDKAEEETELANTINGTSVGRLAEACAASGTPFVHISTDYVFPGDGDRPWTPGDATGPLGAYGASKLLGEEAIESSPAIPSSLCAPPGCSAPMGATSSRPCCALGPNATR